MEARYEDIYTGPLFLAHEHFYVPVAGERERWEMEGECLAGYIEFMDRNDVDTVLPFVRSQQLPALNEHEGRFAPFLNDFIFTTWLNDVSIEEWAGIADTLLGNHEGIEGLGEFALFGLDAETESASHGEIPDEPLRADHEALDDVYEVAADHGVPVMLHPFLQPPQLGPEDAEDPLQSPEVQALANAFDDHPETTFLVHGLQPIGEWIASLLEDHDNWVYDVSGMMTPHPWNAQNPQEPPVDYEQHMTPEHIREHAGHAYHKWEGIFQAAPERVVVGTDMGQSWNIDARVLDSWVATFRSVLGYMDEALARNVAYRNAERMLVEASGD